MKRCIKCQHETTREGGLCEKCGEGLQTTGASSGSGLRGSLSGPTQASSARASGPSGQAASPSSSSTPSPQKGPLFSKPTEDDISVKPSSRSSSMGQPPSGSQSMPPPPVDPPPMYPPPVSPPPMTPPPGYSGASRSRSPLPKVLIGIAGVAVVALITVGVMRFLSDDAYPEPEPDIAYEEIEDEVEEEEVVEEAVEDVVEEDGLTPLTASEIFDANVDAVFTIFYRVPYTQEEILEHFVLRYSLFLPTGNYIYHGSGFFVNSDGVAVTNHHVVVGQGHLVARTEDGEVYPILGYYTYDIDNDIAIIQVEGSGFQYTTFSETPVGVGDDVYAIGSPAGDPNTFTAGNVSRFVEELEVGIYTKTDMIQHTAPIYGGNSGGPLFDRFGKVIGVNSAGIPGRGSVGYAVRIERVDWASALSVPISSFPLGRVVPEVVRDYYNSFPTVPTLRSVSDDVIFFMSGPAADYELDVYGFERIYTYSLMLANPTDIVNLYNSALGERGFIWQDDIPSADGNTVWYYFHHPSSDITVTLWYMAEYELMSVVIGRGNIYRMILGL